MAAKPAGSADAGILIRKLTPADVPQYRPLRLEALRLHPEAFSSDYEEESQAPQETFALRMPPPPSQLVGAFLGDNTEDPRLVGMAGLIVQARAKLRHKAQLVGMYVAPPFRRNGVACALVRRVIDEAQALRLHVLLLGVTADNEPARQLYAQCGFRCYGVERQALYVAGSFYDEELMALRLT